MLKWFKEGVEITDANFGITAKGTTNKTTLIIENHYLDEITLTKPYSIDEHVKIVEFTEKIPFKGKGSVVLEFSPTKERLESLKMKPIGFEVIIG